METRIKKDILMLIIRAGIVIILIAAAIWYLMGLIDKKSQNILDKKIGLLVQQHQQEIQLSLLSDYKDIGQHLDKIKNALPPVEKGTIAFSSILDDLALNNNVKISFNIVSSQVTTLPSGKKTFSVNFNLSADAALENFAKFLYDLENLPYFIIIKNIEIHGGNINSSAQSSLSGILYTK